jgi:hypothetical protein
MNDVKSDAYGGGVAWAQLSEARRRLARLIQTTHFGRICDLHVRGGEPAFDPPPLIIRTVKLAGRPEPRPRTATPGGGFLPHEVVDLLEHLALAGDAVIQRLEIAHGLPLFFEIREPIAAG